LEGKRIVALHIPDAYQFMQPELIDALRKSVGKFVEISNGFDAGRCHIGADPAALRDRDDMAAAAAVATGACRGVAVHGSRSRWLHTP